VNLARVVEDLKNGPVTFKTEGNSMTPKVKSGETVTVVPADVTKVRRGDIVLARVRGRGITSRT
jgi:phage repressor protein C with HTH and peptisase S24 domain